MPNAERAARNPTPTRAAAGGLCVLLLLPSLAPAQDVTVSATHGRKQPLALSDHVLVKLVVEGPAPLSVELPRPEKPGAPPESALLTEESGRHWVIQFVGKPTRTALGGRERWVQEFRLDPYVAGDWFVRFAPLRVNGREVEGPGVALSVNPTKVTAPHDATGIEKLPPPPPAPPTPLAWLWWAVPVAVVLLAAVVAWRVRSRPAPVTPAAWAAGAFGRLDGLSGERLVARVADVLREFVERRFGIPATKLTTSELLSAAAEQSVWSVEETDALRGILDRCDRAKFAGDVPDDDGCRRLLAAGREWVDHVSPARPGPG